MRDEIDALGASLIAVAPAATYQAVRLEPRLGFPLYIDKQRRVRDVLGLHRVTLLGWLTNLRGWLRYLRSLLRIRRQGRITGHHSDLPAVAILDATASVEFLHKGRSMADYPTVDRVIELLRSGNS